MSYDELTLFEAELRSLLIDAARCAMTYRSEIRWEVFFGFLAGAAQLGHAVDLDALSHQRKVGE